jgi:hypothetical protein
MLFATRVVQAFTVRGWAPSPSTGEGRGGGAERWHRNRQLPPHPTLPRQGGNTFMANKYLTVLGRGYRRRQCGLRSG